jgi:hypothetical protein
VIRAASGDASEFSRTLLQRTLARPLQAYVNQTYARNDTEKPNNGIEPREQPQIPPIG